MNKKYISIIVFAIAAIGAGAYFMRTSRNIPNPPQQINQASSTQVATTAVDTSGWDTYRDEKLGFEVKYPKELKGIKNIGYTSQGIVLSLDDYLKIPQELQKEGVQKGDIQLLISFAASKANNPANLSVEDWMLINNISVIETYYSSRAQTPNDKKYITIQGEPAFHLDRADSGYGNGLYAFTDSATFVMHNGYRYIITAALPPIDPTPEWKSHPYYKYLEQSAPITEAIINSFRFTK